MNNNIKVKLGFAFAIMAFCLTIMVSQTQGFCELNTVLGLLFTEYNTYHVILVYTLMWGVILSLYTYAVDKISIYQVNYLANIILLVGFFDLLHDMISILVYFW